MKSKDKIRINIFTAGEDNFHVRLQIPGDRVKEFDVPGTLVEVESEIIGQCEQEADKDTMAKLFATMGIKVFSGKTIDTPTGVAQRIHVAYNHYDEDESGLTWCGESLPDEFKFICIDHALGAAQEKKPVRPCSACLNEILHFLTEVTGR